jgi:2-dehydropantoate 2-reductase
VEARGLLDVLVVGAGAVGSLLGHVLSAGGANVTLTRRGHPGPPETRDLVRTDPDGTRVPAEVTTARIDAVESEPSVIILAVKMFDLERALDVCARWPAAPTVTVQNGIGAEALASARRPQASLVAASLTASVDLAAGGNVRRFRQGGIGLAGEGAVVADLTAAFVVGGLPCRSYRDADAMKWSKLVGNLVGNATGAIVDLDPRDVYSHPGLFEVERRQLREGLAVMTKLGLEVVALPGAPVPWIARAVSLPSGLGRMLLPRFVGGARGGKPPSLRGHVQGRGDGDAGRSEVEWLNGAVVEHGRRIGVATPVNAALVALVQEVGRDPGRRAWFRGEPSRVAEAVLGGA